MALELIVNIALLFFSMFCFYYVGTTMPKSAVTELGAEQWPQMILIVLIAAILWNIRNYFKRNDTKDISAAFKDFFPGIIRLVKSKLFWGMAILMVMAYAYEPIGFIATSLVFLIAYGLLLGERKPLFLILTSILITIILYIGFSVLLGVMLPRGNVSFLRNFALFLESIVQRVTS